MSEYELDTEGNENEVNPIDTSATTEFSENEKELLKKIEALTNELAQSGATCFIAAKFESQDSPSAAWHFGKEPNTALTAFAKDYAPLMIHITSKFTGTKVVATNAKTGALVYEVSPWKDGEEPQQNDTAAPADSEG